MAGSKGSSLRKRNRRPNLPHHNLRKWWPLISRKLKGTADETYYQNDPTFAPSSASARHKLEQRPTGPMGADMDKKLMPRTIHYCLLVAVLGFSGQLQAQAVAIRGTGNPEIEVPAVQAAVDHGGQVVLMGHFPLTDPQRNGSKISTAGRFSCRGKSRLQECGTKAARSRLLKAEITRSPWMP